MESSVPVRPASRGPVRLERVGSFCRGLPPAVGRLPFGRLPGAGERAGTACSRRIAPARLFLARIALEWGARNWSCAIVTTPCVLRRGFPARRAAVVTLFAILFGAGPAQAANAWDVATLHEDRPAWEGFGVGTMVHYRVTTTRGEEGDSATSQSTEVKELLRAVTETAFEITKTRKAAGGWLPGTTYSMPRRATRPKREITPAGTEKIRVGDTDYTCKKLEVATTRPGADGLPCGGAPAPGL